MKQLLLFVIALLPMMVSANDLSDNGIYYQIKSDGSLEVTGLASGTTVADIPSSITINGSKYRVTSIGAYAFDGRSDITYLSIPYSIKTIGEYAFRGCGSSMTVNIADPESWCQMQLGNEHASPLSSAGKLLVHDIETTSIDIPETVISISAFTFYQCSCITSVNIPGTVTSIGSSAFEDCDYLTSLTLNEGLQSIGGSAFEGCKRLANLVLPSTVNSILINAFKNCVGLTDVYCSAANVPNTDASAFSGVATENVALHVPDNAVNAYKSTWPWSNFKGNIDMSKSRTIHVGVAGTLSNYIPTGEIQYVEELTLTGYLNGTDIGFIRRMAGAPVNYDGSEIYKRAERGQIYGKLAVLDISDATIVSGGDSYYNLWWVDDGNDLNAFIREEYSTSDNIISWSMFADCKFTKVSLPNNIMEIDDAFDNCESLTSIDIPQSVTSIGSYAFSGCSGLTSITIPNSVTSIGSSAFSDTGWYNNQANGLLYLDKWLLGYKGDKPVGEIKIAEDTKGIADYAFSGCSGLTSVTIPKSVTKIGFYAFPGCSGLTSVTIPNSVTSIDMAAFSGCSGLTSVTIPNSVTSIGEDAFRGCSGLTSVTIPNSVTSIGESAFSGCSGLTSVTIPNSVTSIDYKAFYDCGLTSVTSLIRTPISLSNGTFSNYNIPLYVPSESVEAYKATEPWSNFSSILAIDSTPSQNVGDTFKAQTKEGVWMTFKITSLEPKTCQVGDGEDASIDVATVGKVTIPVTANGFKVTSIGGWAFFYGCDGLTSVTIPNSVTSIGEFAFGNCRGLTSVTIGNSVISIGKMAFEYCSGLTSVTIPNSVTSIGEFAFRGCSSLTSVTIPNSVTSIGDGAFSGCSNLATITVDAGNTAYNSPDGSNAIIETTSNKLVVGCKNTTMPNSVTSIGSYAFYDCSGLTSVTIPNSVTNIGWYAFSGCSGLTSIKVEGGNQAYDSRNDCNAIIEKSSNTLIAGCKNTIIPNSVTSIGTGAFYGCRGLTSVTIPNSVTSIGDGAFSGCSGLTSVTIPNSVTYIYSDAFSGCSGLTSVTIPNSVTNIGWYAFYGCDGLTSVTSLIRTPISLSNGTFSNYNIPLYVPSESVEAYKATEPWSNFSSILAIDSTPSQNVGDTFKAQTKEGVWMTFKITSLEPKTCQVGDGEDASIDVATVGKVTIPETANDYKVTAIGSKGFYNCSKLTAIYLSENIESIGDQAFYGCTSLTILDIPRSVKVISNTAFDNCGGSSGITINVSADNTSVIPNNNKVKVNITKPTEETTISLERVFIPKSVKNIGERSFSYCKSVIRMEVEEGHTIFDSRENCNAIIGTATNTLLFGCQNTVIPETVTSIGAYAFEGHSNLKTITIPSGISSIGVNAFGSCEGLTNVISEIESPFAINDNTFDAQTYETAQLTVPCGTKEKYQNTAGWKNFINIVDACEGEGSDENTLNGWNYNSDGYYEISNVDDMVRLSAYVREGNTCEGLAFKVVIGEMDFDGVSMSPIGYYRSSSNYTPFKGKFDGQGVVIKNLSMSDKMTYRFGLFGYIYGAEISSITMAESCSILGFDGVGSIVGYNEGGIVCGCVNFGSVSSSNRNIGGIVGYNEAFTATGEFVGGIVKDCENHGDINPGYYNAGGIVGHNVTGSVIHCTNTGSISSSENSYIGGIVGFQERGQVSDCYVNSCTLNGKNYVGAIFGKMDYVKVSIGYTSAGLEYDNYYASNVTVVLGGTGETYNGTTPRGVGEQWKAPYDVPEIIYSKLRYKNSAMLSSELQGDANNDDNISTEDISTTENYILNEDSNGINIKNADANGDQKVNVADMVLIINNIKTSGEEVDSEGEGVVVYQSDKGQSIYCNGIYPYDSPDAVYFSQDLSILNHNHFRIEFDYIPEAAGPVMVLSHSSRVLAINIDSNLRVFITTNNGDHIYSTQLSCRLNSLNHLDLKFNNGSMTVNGMTFQTIMNVSDNVLTSVNYSNGKAYKGSLRNVIVTSY